MTHEREAPPAWVVLAATVVLAGVFFCVGDRVTAELRGLAGAGLRAGQLQVANLSGWCREGLVIWAAVQGRAEELRHARLESDRWQNLYRELQYELGRRGTAALAAAQAESSAPLLQTEMVPARVLGRSATNFLRKQLTLSIGTREGVQEEALVLDENRPLLDQGAPQGIAPEQIVLAEYSKGATGGRAVLGRIGLAGQRTSSLQLVTDPKFHAVAQIVHLGEQGPVFGPEGLLAGSGERSCRLGGVEIHHPVAVGDSVYATEGKGLLTEPLVFGHVAAVKAGPDGATWDIKVQPAADLDALAIVQVLRTELNPTRVAEGGKSTATR